MVTVSYHIDASATPLNYRQIQITWDAPLSGSQVRLVRNVPGPAATIDDGVALVTTPAGAGGLYVDNPPAAFAGRIAYYSLFVQDSSGEWWRGADIETVLPVDWGYGQMLESIPAWVQQQDSLMVDASGATPGPLASFLDLLAFGADVNRTWLEQLQWVADPAKIPANLLPSLAALLGADVEPGIGYAQTRRLLSELVHLYKTKGTLEGIAGISSAVTGWAASVAVGPNLCLYTDLVGAADQGHLVTGLVANDNGVPTPPLGYVGTEGQPPLPQTWPSDFPPGTVRVPAQGWFLRPNEAGALPELTITSLQGGDPRLYGIPLSVSQSSPPTTSSTTTTTSKTFTITVEQPPAVWGKTNWGQSIWNPSFSVPPAPKASLTAFGIEQTSLPPASEGLAYNEVLTTAFANGSVAWSVIDGELPTGLTLTPAGEIAGTPTATGTWTFTVQAVLTSTRSVPAGLDVSASIRLWAAGFSVEPTLYFQLHFWDQFGKSLGLSSSTSGTATSTAWLTLSLTDIAAPAGTAFVSYEVTTNGQAITFGPNSVLIAAMPYVAATPTLGSYTNPRALSITLQPDRANLIANPSFTNGQVSGWSALNASLELYELFSGSANLLSAIDASFEGGVGTWTGYLGSVSSVADTEALDGTDVLRWQNGQPWGASTGFPQNANVPITPDGTFTWVAASRPVANPQTFAAQLATYRSAVDGGRQVSAYGPQIHVQEQVDAWTFSVGTAKVGPTEAQGHPYVVYDNMTGELGAPAAPSVTPQGTAGTTSYAYEITYSNQYGETVPSVAATITTGNATLTTTNYNAVAWSMPPQNLSPNSGLTSQSGWSGNASPTVDTVSYVTVTGQPFSTAVDLQSTATANTWTDMDGPVVHVQAGYPVVLSFYGRLISGSGAGSVFLFNPSGQHGVGLRGLNFALTPQWERYSVAGTPTNDSYSDTAWYFQGPTTAAFEWQAGGFQIETPVNLLTPDEASFENGSLGSWQTENVGTGGNRATLAVSTAEAYSGTHSMAVTCDGSIAYQGAQLAMPVTANEEATTSVWVFFPAGATGRVVTCYSNPGTGASTTFTGTGAWQQVVLTATASAANPTLYIDTGATAQAITFYVDSNLVYSGPAWGANQSPSPYQEITANVYRSVSGGPFQRVVTNSYLTDFDDIGTSAPSASPPTSDTTGEAHRIDCSGIFPGSPGYPLVVLGDGPSAYWPLWDAEGSTSVENLVSSDTASVNGAVILGEVVGPVTAFPNETAALLPGSATSDTVGIRSSTDRGRLSQFTLECWVSYEALPDVGSAGAIGAHQYADIGLVPSGQIRYECFDPALTTQTGPASFTYTPPAGYLGQWIHLAMSFNAGTVTCYYNGQQVDQFTNNSTSIDLQSINIGTWDRTMEGSVAHAALYPRALTAAQVEAHYNAASATGDLVEKWTPGGTGAAERDYAAVITASSTGSVTVYSDPMPVSADASDYFASLEMASLTEALNVRAYVELYDASDNPLGTLQPLAVTTALPLVNPMTEAGFTQVPVAPQPMAPIPAGAVTARVVLYFPAVNSGDEVVFDNVDFEEGGVVLPYIDGSSPDAVWSNPASSTGPSYVYANADIKLMRLGAILQGVPGASVHQACPMDTTGFLPLGFEQDWAIYTIESNIPAVLPAPTVTARPQRRPAAHTSLGGWGYGEWGVSDWGDAGNRAQGTLSSSTPATNPTGTLPLASMAYEGEVGVPYSSSLGTTAGEQPYTYTITSGALPPGLTLGPSSGTVAGTPTTAGSYTFTLNVTDSTGNTGAATYDLVINAAPAPLAFSTSTTLPSGTQGSSYSTIIAATGGTTPYTFTASVPPGMKMSSGGTVSTNALPALPLYFPVTVTDALGNTHTAAFEIP